MARLVSMGLKSNGQDRNGAFVAILTKGFLCGAVGSHLDLLSHYCTTRLCFTMYHVK